VRPRETPRVVGGPWPQPTTLAGAAPHHTIHRLDAPTDRRERSVRPAAGAATTCHTRIDCVAVTSGQLLNLFSRATGGSRPLAAAVAQGGTYAQHPHNHVWPGTGLRWRGRRHVPAIVDRSGAVEGEGVRQPHLLRAAARHDGAQLLDASTAGRQHGDAVPERRWRAGGGPRSSRRCRSSGRLWPRS